MRANASAQSETPSASDKLASGEATESDVRTTSILAPKQLDRKPKARGVATGLSRTSQLPTANQPGGDLAARWTTAHPKLSPQDGERVFIAPDSSPYMVLAAEAGSLTEAAGMFLSQAYRATSSYATYDAAIEFLQLIHPGTTPEQAYRVLDEALASGRLVAVVRCGEYVRFDGSIGVTLPVLFVMPPGALDSVAAE
jgi:hypothetical protein